MTIRLRVVAFSRPPPFLAAVDRGLFAAAGIEVELTRATSSSAQLEGLLSGGFDIAHTAADNVVARVDKGGDLRIVLVAELGADQRLIGLPEVRRMTDLAGKTLGVDASDSGHALRAYALLADAGLARDSYRTVAVGGTRERLAALFGERIDAALLAPPYDEPALAAGCTVLADVSERFADHPGLTVAVRGEWAAANRGAVEGYCRALLAGARWAADPANADAVVELIAGDEEIRSERARGRYVRWQRHRIPTVAEAAQAIQAVCALRRELGFATGPIVVDRYFDPSFMRAAEGSPD